jgi:uncharacterized LabA/DUF88 family protein
MGPRYRDEGADGRILPMPLKAGLYVDAANLYRKDGPSINYRVLKEYVSGGRELLRSNAYVTVDPDNPKPVKGFISALRDIGFKVIEKEWTRSSDGRVKANMDMELAVDMLTQAENLDVIVLASGDSDFVRLVRAVQNLGKRVEVIAFQDRIGFDLIKEADSFNALESLNEIFMSEPDPPQPLSNQTPALEKPVRGEERPRFFRR